MVNAFCEMSEPGVSNGRDTFVAWLATSLFCFYCICSYLTLYHNITNLVPLYAPMGLVLPYSTRFMIAASPGLPLLFFCVVGALVIVKELFVKDKKRSLTITLAVSVCTLLMVNWMTTALFMPFAWLIDKLTH